jgi:hypothetical protein
MHVFMSYARADDEIVKPLSVVLNAFGIRTWLDTEGLPPGTPQWDQMIRTALRDSHALIAFCSENARDSQYVPIELEIAKGYQKKIFPVWISGDSWTESAPFALVLSQHIDLRQPQRREGISRLINALKQHLAALPMQKRAQPWGPSTNPLDDWPFLRVEWKDKYTYLNPFLHESWGEALNEVYLSLVKEAFPPFSYGENWALAISGGGDLNEHEWPLFALPASWAAMPFRRVHEIDLAWVRSPADLELASTIRPPNRFKKHFCVQVVDLLTLPPRIDFIGLRCNYRTFLSFATVGHPKAMLLRLEMSLDDFGIEDCSQAFLHFEIPQPRVQVVTIVHKYYRMLEKTVTEGLSITPDGKIVEVEEDRKWKARGIMRALRMSDGTALLLLLLFLLSH